MIKRYQLINRRTGKTNRSAATRADARLIKAAGGFKHDIYDSVNGKVVR